MTTIYRYIQLGVHVRARYEKGSGKFMREVCEVTEFFVNDKNEPESNTLYRKNIDGTTVINPPSSHLIDYLEAQGVDLTKKEIQNMTKHEAPFEDDNKKTETNTPNETKTTSDNMETLNIIDDLDSNNSSQDATTNNPSNNEVLNPTNSLASNDNVVEAPNNINKSAEPVLNNMPNVNNTNVIANEPVSLNAQPVITPQVQVQPNLTNGGNSAVNIQYDEFL